MRQKPGKKYKGVSRADLCSGARLSIENQIVDELGHRVIVNWDFTTRPTLLGNICVAGPLYSRCNDPECQNESLKSSRRIEISVIKASLDSITVSVKGVMRKCHKCNMPVSLTEAYDVAFMSRISRIIVTRYRNFLYLAKNVTRDETYDWTLESFKSIEIRDSKWS